jgi:endoglycosylceramidase
VKRFQPLQVAVGVVAVMAAACFDLPGDAPAAPARRFPVSDGFLRDDQGRAVVMRGANLSNEHKYPPYIGFHEAADYRELRETWGMNAVRFLVSWAALEPTPGVWDEAYLDTIAERLAWAKAAGLLVVIDMHQDLYGEGFGIGDGFPTWTCPAEHYEAFTPEPEWFFNYLDPAVTACYDNFWYTESLWDAYAAAVAHVGARFAALDHVVGIDLMNEPYWGSAELDRFEEGTLQPFYEHVIPVVRDAAPAWTIFVEPASFRNLGVASHLQPLPFADIVYAPHSYDTAAERGEGFDEAFRDRLTDNLSALRAEADALGAALWIGEYGGMASSPGITPYLDATYDGAGAVAASSMVWQYGRSDDYGLIGDDGLGKPVLLDVLVRPTPSRVAGTPRSWTFDEVTGVFTLLLTADATITAPTEIIAPARTWPTGIDVACDAACDVAIDGDVVAVRGVVERITLTPR